MLGIERIFSANMWKTFGSRLIETVYKRDSFYYDFGFGAKDVRIICKYYQDPETAKVLRQVINDNNLRGKTEKETVYKVMKWLNDTYPSSHFYMQDKGERWNTPLETLQSWQNRKKMNWLYAWSAPHEAAWYLELSTDCDDYAIFQYNLLRIAGVSENNLRLCFMQTETEWHLNVMFFDKNIPYAVEGTYNPENAIRNLGNVPYFENRYYNGTEWVNYYTGVRWLFNENEIRRNSYE
jgi:hypothetical protein